MNREELLKYYSLRADQFKALADRDKRIIAWLSLARLVLFVGGITISVFMFRSGPVPGALSLLLTAVLFAFLLKFYSLRAWKRDYSYNMHKVNLEEISAIKEDYSGFRDGRQFTDTGHDFSHDIDLFGPGSVFQSLNRTSTEKGEEQLADWLLNPYEQSRDFELRRDAVKELSEKTEWRQRLSSLGMMKLTSLKETESFVKWLKEKPEFSGSWLVRLMLIVLPVATLGLFILWSLSLVTISWFIYLFLVNLTIVGFRLAKLNRIHGKVSKRSAYLSIAGLLIEHINAGDFDSAFLKQQQEKLSAGAKTAEEEVKKLSQLINAFDSRLNMIMGVVLNGVLLWDFQCVVRIEQWKQKLSVFVPSWFDSIAVMDAVNSLAYFANNKPGFVYPEICNDDTYLEAKGLGHHLIPSGKRITNNYLIPKEGTVNIITGANMAGKSTFLRTVAVNMILAMCGTPVCALSFRFTPVDIYTSMRTSDSLSDEESYFFAELKRLRRLIERLEKNERPFFILDEILKGTNSKDKSEGSKAFLEKVISLGATGLIATHDISLGHLENKYPDKVFNNCFEIEIERGDVIFDFLLREGITSKMNAALLMKQQGII